ncbi:MAG: Sugar transporter SemiSWEET [Deltaproteobacteria bacterium]|nr:Sugar transporter SemiSWEET [Deltaproteobacteria bacterium]
MRRDHNNLDLRADIIGYVAACFTTFSLLPQIARIWRLKEAKDVSLLMPLMVAAGSALWVVYGFTISSPPVVAANAVALLIALVTVVFAVRYRR